ncbi:MAG: phosphonate C-P lyase system protein PhnH [Coriobacteriia bacterium]|nr:phosphonate C-P lyase system protein PhnH [Coriobacteriia bacterium]
MTAALSKKHDFDVVFDSQKVFRLVLEALSHPAREVSILECARRFGGKHSALLALALTLLDNEVSFNTCENHQLSDDIAALTLAHRSTVDKADFIFVCNLDDLKDVIEHAKCGTLENPHQSATIVILDEQGNDVPAHRLCLVGPGIDVSRTVTASPALKQALILRDAQHYEYPQGIDLLFVSGKGELYAIPRLVRQGEVG